jgi:hypothetical protein
LGYFVHQDFLGDYTTGAATVAPGIGSDADASTTYAVAASATYGPNVISPAVTNTDNNALALLTNELGQIVRNSGNKFWAETRIAVGALGDSAFAFGLTTLANATRDIVADNPSNSARAGLTAASFIGFVSCRLRPLWRRSMPSTPRARARRSWSSPTSPTRRRSRRRVARSRTSRPTPS